MAKQEKSQAQKDLELANKLHDFATRINLIAADDEDVANVAETRRVADRITRWANRGLRG